MRRPTGASPPSSISSPPSCGQGECKHALVGSRNSYGGPWCHPGALASNALRARHVGQSISSGLRSDAMMPPEALRASLVRFRTERLSDSGADLNRASGLSTRISPFVAFPQHAVKGAILLSWRRQVVAPQFAKRETRNYGATHACPGPFAPAPMCSGALIRAAHGPLDRVGCRAGRGVDAPASRR